MSDPPSGEVDPPAVEEEAWHGLTVLEHNTPRLSNFRLDLADEHGQIPSPTAELRSDTWHHWLKIAREHADLAAVARAHNPGVLAAPEFNEAVIREFLASLVSVSASAFTMEAFLHSVGHRFPD